MLRQGWDKTVGNTGISREIRQIKTILTRISAAVYVLLLYTHVQCTCIEHNTLDVKETAVDQPIHFVYILLIILINSSNLANSVKMIQL